MSTTSILSSTSEALPAHIEPSEDSHPVGTLEKQDRKRLKKLRKRATNVISDGDRSGLLTQLEWLEFQKLATMDKAEQEIFVGPSVSRRKRKEGNKVEGSHHRDLVAWFMNRIQDPDDVVQTQSKKRKQRDDDDSLKNPSIPAWASIHNPATIDGLVILEINLSSAEKVSTLDKCQSAVDMATSKAKSRKALHLPTKWFQGYVPKCHSDSLFYFVSNTKQVLQSKLENDCPPSMDQLLVNLEEMILPQERWNDEKYPLMIDKEKQADSDSHPYIQFASDARPLDVTTISLADANKLVAQEGFRVEDQKDDDSQLFLATPPGSTAHASSDVRVFGMDCEMVLTSLGSELARITLVQLESFEDDQVNTTLIMDVLVKPANPVKDYLTRHSGITAELLEPVSTQLAQVQAALWLFLRPNDILVGHSLENDLLATHYLHPRIIDTSLVFRHRNKRTKFSLRHMSAYLLKKTIQQGSHCSQEDAEATLELAVRRAYLGDGFAVPNTDERRSILEKWNGAKESKTVCIGPPKWLQAHVTNHANGVHALGYESLAECKKAVLAWTKGPRKAQLTWCHLNLNDDLESNVDAFQQLLEELLLQLSPSTMVLVAFQESLDKAREGFATRRACQDPRSSIGWNAEKEALWQPILETARQGVASWIGMSNGADNV